MTVMRLRLRNVLFGVASALHYRFFVSLCKKCFHFVTTLVANDFNLVMAGCHGNAPSSIHKLKLSVNDETIADCRESAFVHSKNGRK